jgi:hypothetical protein
VPFLALNGMAVPVATLSKRFVEAGASERAFDGTLRSSRRALKRQWQAKTAPMTALEADLLERVLLGQGDAWPLDGHIYSSKGIGPTSSSAVSAYTAARAADGLDILNEAKFGNGAWVGVPNTNLLTANQRGVETDTSGFTAVDGATISRDTTYKLAGAASLKVVTSAAANATRGGAKTNALTTAVATQHRGSVYLMATSAVTVRVLLRNSTTATDGTPVTKTLTAYKWERVVDVLSPAFTTGDGLELHILEDTADAGITFYVDNLQVEASASKTSCWSNGSGTTGKLVYSPYSFAGHEELTINCWAARPVATAGFLFAISKTNATRKLALAYLSAGQAQLQVGRSDNSLFTTNVSSVIGATGLTMVTIVLRTSRSPHYALYADGVLKASGDLTPAPDPASAGMLELLCYNSVSRWEGLADDFLLLPFAASASMISGWFSLGRALGAWPRLWLTGDCIPEPAAQVHAKLESSPMVPHADTSGFQSAGRSVSFSLLEV